MSVETRLALSVGEDDHEALKTMLYIRVQSTTFDTLYTLRSVDTTLLYLVSQKRVLKTIS
jgi:hypothetical protein